MAHTPPLLGRTSAPLLDGRLAERAIATIDEIAAALRQPPRAWAPPGSSESERAVLDASLAGGRAGLAVFFATRARTRPKGGDGQLASDFLADAIRALAEVPMSSSLFSGFTGVAWATLYVMGESPRRAGPVEESRTDESGDERDDRCSAIDDALAGYLTRSPWNDHYDLVSGLAGLGLYALERLPHATARSCAERVVLRLDELARHTSEGITWHTPRELLGTHERDRYEQGYFNLGMAHGVPGLVVVLARCVASGVEARRARRLLEGAVAWLLAQRGPEPGRRMPFAIAPGIDRLPARTAWCYGDPGVAAALLLAGSLTGEEAWIAEALVMAREVADLPPDACGVEDAGLCHGAMGLAHLCHHFHRATGEPRFADAARRWFEYGLALRRPGIEVAGFPASIPDETGKKGWAPDPGLLGGAAGVGLALIAATTDADWSWDVPLLLSAPAATP